MMEIKELKKRSSFTNQRLEKCYHALDRLLIELRTRSLPDKTIQFINEKIDAINAPHDEKELKRIVSRGKNKIVKYLEKEHKIVPKNYYRTMWTGIGMSAIGIPFGVAFGNISGNMALLGTGIPIGMAIGIGIGTRKDKEAEKNGLQLNSEIR